MFMSADTFDASYPCTLPTVVTVPAETRSLALVRSTVEDALAECACDGGCHVDLQLAADELASVLIPSAAPESQLHLSIAHDDEDIYVRMSVPICGLPQEPVDADLTHRLLQDTVGSYDLCLDGDLLVGVLQHAISSAAQEG